MFLAKAFSGLVGLALIASRIACILVIAWFVVFAVDQSKTAADHQVNELAGTTQQQPAQPPAKHSGATRTLDKVARTLTSPFTRLTEGRSAWFIHGVDTLLALLLYGVGVGFLARFVRLRV